MGRATPGVVIRRRLHHQTVGIGPVALASLVSTFTTILNRVTNGFATAVSRVLLGGKRQTWAPSPVSRRDLSSKLTWGAHRRRLDFSPKGQNATKCSFSIPSYMEAVLKMQNLGSTELFTSRRFRNQSSSYRTFIVFPGFSLPRVKPRNSAEEAVSNSIPDLLTAAPTAKNCRNESYYKRV